MTTPYPMPSPMPSRLPPPNLRGDYDGSCVLCLRGTDTATAFRGSLNAIVAAVAHYLGIPVAEAIDMVEQLQIPSIEKPPFDVLFRLCETCAARRNLRVGLLVDGAPGYDLSSLG